MTEKMSIPAQMEVVRETNSDEDVSSERQTRPQKLRRRGEEDDTKAAKGRGTDNGVLTEGGGPGRKSKACECIGI